MGEGEGSPNLLDLDGSKVRGEVGEADYSRGCAEDDLVHTVVEKELAEVDERGAVEAIDTAAAIASNSVEEIDTGTVELGDRAVEGSVDGLARNTGE